MGKGWRLGWIVALFGGAAVSAQAALPLDDAAACAAETLRHERSQAIPANLLSAISLVESGRWDSARKASVAWPWTVTAEGTGRFLASKAAAIAEVRALRARGVTNIDVGCMQVNLHWHPDAFASLEQAFEPASNVGYATRFLKSLFAATRDWPLAASYYHSQTPQLAALYRTKLEQAWAELEEGRPNVSPELLRPRESLRRVVRLQEARRAESLAEREEARRIAEAYRRARVEEYHLRRLERGRAGSG